MKARDIIDIGPLVLDRGVRVMATQSVGDILEGDVGTVRAAWMTGQLMSIHRKRLVIAPEQ